MMMLRLQRRRYRAYGRRVLQSRTRRKHRSYLAMVFQMTIPIPTSLVIKCIHRPMMLMATFPLVHRPDVVMAPTASASIIGARARITVGSLNGYSATPIEHAYKTFRH